MAVETSARTILDDIQGVADKTDGLNQWSMLFPRTLRYCDGASQEDVENLGHERMFSLAQRLQEGKTINVTSEILEEFIKPEEPEEPASNLPT